MRGVDVLERPSSIGDESKFPVPKPSSRQNGPQICVASMYWRPSSKGGVDRKKLWFLKNKIVDRKDWIEDRKNGETGKKSIEKRKSSREKIGSKIAKT